MCDVEEQFPPRPRFAHRESVSLKFALLLLSACLLGCSGGDDLKKVVVSGAVTYKGQPVEAGMIRFHPLPGTDGPVSGASIREGRYVADGRGGVPVGEHEVLFQSLPTGDADGDLMSGGQQGGSQSPESIPARYRTQSGVYVTIEGGSSEVTRDFHLD